jgi:hypothetical protein
MRVRRLTPGIAVLSLMLLGGGCGAAPPQAPAGAAAKLDTSLSGISTACGLAYQVSAFPPPPAAQLTSLEATAGKQAMKLASVFHENPGWIYQGETVSTIVDDAISMLGSCGLSEARRALAGQIGAQRRGGR